METIFTKIINKEIPADIIYEAIPKLSDATPEDQALLGHLMLVAGEVSRMLELDDTFRLVTNNGANAGQSVFHLHLHLLSGRSLTWPPG